MLVRPYSYDYKTCTEEAKKDKEENNRPALKEYLPSPDAYDTIVLCFELLGNDADGGVYFPGKL